jgi:hypothetical protein
VLVMVVIGGVYLGYLLVTRGLHGLRMPDMHSIDAELDHVALDDPSDVHDAPK